MSSAIPVRQKPCSLLCPSTCVVWPFHSGGDWVPVRHAAVSQHVVRGGWLWEAVSQPLLLPFQHPLPSVPQQPAKLPASCQVKPHTSNTAPISWQVRAQSHSRGGLGVLGSSPLHAIISAEQGLAGWHKSSPVSPSELLLPDPRQSPHLHGWGQMRLSLSWAPTRERVPVVLQWLPIAICTDAG